MRFAKPIDWLIYGGGTLLCVLVCIYFIVFGGLKLVEQIVLMIVAFGFIVGAFIFFYIKYKTYPKEIKYMDKDFIKRNNLDKLERLVFYGDISNEQKHFIHITIIRTMLGLRKHFPYVFYTWPKQISITVSKKPIIWYNRFGWKIKDKAGLQSGSHIWLYFSPSHGINAHRELIKHEIGHMYQALTNEYDPQHKSEFWKELQKIELV